MYGVTVATREKALIGQVVRARRSELGLTQRQLAEVVSLGGVDWDQRIVAKVEGGTRDLTLLEVALLMLALQTDLVSLLGPGSDEIEGPDGQVDIPAAAVALILAGDVDEALELSIDLEILHKAAEHYAGDPDFVALEELTGIDPGPLTAALTIYGNDPMTRGDRRSRKSWRAQDVVELELGPWRADNPEPTEHALRQARTQALRRVGDGCREIVAAYGGELG